MSAMTPTPNSNETSAAFPSDRDLLRRFIHDGDEGSFAAIVERHAKLVMSVCRRVVGQSPDVDDAFQATFFALAQRPASIYECRSLTGWLYSVAWRASVRLVRLRKRTMTQPLPEQTPASEPDPLDVIAEANNLATLDEELNQLPQKYRDVLVMSYFAQQTNQEIADQLNESKGAVDGRIRDARRMLRVRLARRGVEVGVLAVATAWVQSSASAASPALIQKAISLGAPGIFPHECAALNAAEVAHMKLLTSAGIPLMSKIGLAITAGLVFASGLWGMSHLAAFQDAIGGGKVAATDNPDARKGDASELKGQTSAEPQTAVDDGGDVIGVVSTTAVSPAAAVPTATASTKTRRSGVAGATEFSRRGSREAERRINEIMEEELVKSLSFPGENPLSDILEQIAGHLSQTTKQRIVIDSDRLALEQESIASLQDVKIKDVEIDSIPVGSALDFVLRQTDPPLTWIAKDEFLYITTCSAAESEENLILRSYDISRLREISKLTVVVWDTSGGQGSGGGGFFQFGGMGGGGNGVVPKLQQTEPSTPQAETVAPVVRNDQPVTWEAGLMQIVQDMSSPPCRWLDTDGEGGRLHVAGNRLLVRQSRPGHQAIIEVLEQLEIAAEEAAE